MDDNDLSPYAWSVGLSPPDLYEWITNCYQLRCDDDYVWGGCYLHGPYLCEASAQSIAEDFIIFCVLAQDAGVIPQNWNWKEFLNIAYKFAGYGFEKSDAQERWGNENVFMGALGGRSLRYTGSVVYGTGAQEQAFPPTAGDKKFAVYQRAKRGARKWENSEFFDKIGGLNIWTDFVTALAGIRNR